MPFCCSADGQSLSRVDAGAIGFNVSVCICMDVAMHEIGDSIRAAERRRGGVGSERGKMDGVELQDECR